MNESLSIVTFSADFLCTENMWGSYGPAGMMVEKDLPSVPATASPQDKAMPYVVNDIATFFTLLVGIYFPSVTGTNAFMLRSLQSFFLSYFLSLLVLSFSPLCCSVITNLVWSGYEREQRSVLSSALRLTLSSAGVCVNSL